MSNLTRSKKWKASLSLCMIVKNEAETLEKCLRYARPFVDEIVIVDTGSTDGTREIAQRYADIYDEIEWPKSFSKARNHSYDLASSDFIMYLDGDEYLPGATEWRRIRRSLHDGIAALQLYVVNMMRESSMVAADRFQQIRVMRNAKEVRFEGKVHNQIGPGIDRYRHRTDTDILQVDAEIVHVGYSYDADKMREKYEPRVELLIDEYESPRSPHLRAYYGYQLAVAYNILQSPEQVLDVLDTLDFHLLNKVNAFYTNLLGAQAALECERHAMALGYCEQMLAISREEPSGYYLAGASLLKLGEPEHGLLMLMEAYRINQMAGRQVRFKLSSVRLASVLATVCDEAGLTRQAELLRGFIDDRHEEEVLGQAISLLQENIARLKARKDVAALDQL